MIEEHSVMEQLPPPERYVGIDDLREFVTQHQPRIQESCKIVSVSDLPKYF